MFDRKNIVKSFVITGHNDHFHDKCEKVNFKKLKFL